VPCPRCLVTKSKLDNLGLARDIAIRIQGCRKYMASRVEAARRLIYDFAKPITGAGVDGLLKEFSGVPTKVSTFLFRRTRVLIHVWKNAFVERLGSGFNPSNMLVVDLLHEFELGVWKTLLTHLIRVLYAAGGGTDRVVIELDSR
jgi:hypothetical protein